MLLLNCSSPKLILFYLSHLSRAICILEDILPIFSAIWWFKHGAINDRTLVEYKNPSESQTIMQINTTR